jgi:hypothetical protein
MNVLFWVDYLKKDESQQERCLFEGFEIKYYPEDEFDNIEPVPQV